MKKRLFSLLLCLVMAASCLPMTASAKELKDSEHRALPASAVTDYLERGDYVTILPAENKNGAVKTTLYALSGQAGGNANGMDVHMWKFGSAVKWCVRREDSGKFALISTNFRESEGRSSGGNFTFYWDLEGTKSGSGTNIHVWEDDDTNDDNKLFFLVEDNDGDPETFYIASYWSYCKEKGTIRYVVPEEYHSDGRTWEEDGRNMVLSKDKFRWRVQVLNRVPDSVEASVEWMAGLPNDAWLADINIPGTHDAATANVSGSAVEEANNTACQKYFIDEQLIAGVRAFDIRCDGKNDEIVTVHGRFVCHYREYDGGDNYTLDMVLGQMEDFLKEHPSETVVVVVKNEGDNTWNDDIISDFMKRESILYDWSGGNPTLGDARGKIVVMTRLYVADASARPYFGPDLTGWDANYEDNNHWAQKINADGSTYTDVYIQDDYNCSDSNKKTQVLSVTQQLNGDLRGAPAVGPEDFVFNYLSKTYSDENGLVGANPWTVSQVMNGYIIESSIINTYFAGNSRTGIVMMDYADKNMAQYVIDSNRDRDFVRAVSTVYSDVPEDAWYYEAVQETTEQGLMEGVTEDTFAPEDPMTRGDLTEALYNAEGEPPVEEPEEPPFTDVEEDHPNAAAIQWAEEKGLVNGFGDGTFAPDAPLTREQIAKILRGYAEYLGYDVSAAADLSAFTDGTEVSPWAEDVMAWAVASGLMTGDQDQLFPGGETTRAEMAQMLVNFLKTHKPG